MHKAEFKLDRIPETRTHRFGCTCTEKLWWCGRGQKEGYRHLRMSSVRTGTIEYVQCLRFVVAQTCIRHMHGAGATKKNDISGAYLWCSQIQGIPPARKRRANCKATHAHLLTWRTARKTESIAERLQGPSTTRWAQKAALFSTTSASFDKAEARKNEHD